VGATIIPATEADLVNEGLRAKGVLPQSRTQRVEIPAQIVDALHIQGQAALLTAMIRDLERVVKAIRRVASGLRTGAADKMIRANTACQVADALLEKALRCHAQSLERLEGMGFKVQAPPTPAPPAEDAEEPAVEGEQESADVVVDGAGDACSEV
jgi:hypothetical protein